MTRFLLNVLGIVAVCFLAGGVKAQVTTLPGETEYVSSKTLKPGAWELLVFPGGGYTSFSDLIGNSLNENDFGVSWIVFRWNADQRLYEIANLSDEPKQGEGIWIIQTSSEDVIISVNNRSQNLTLIDSAPCLNINGCVSLDLLPSDDSVRWNLLGSPGNAWTRETSFILHDSSSDCSNGCSLTQNEIIRDRISLPYAYDSTSGSYISPFFEDFDSIVSEWTAWWIGTRNTMGRARILIDSTQRETMADPYEQIEEIEQFEAPNNLGDGMNAQLFTAPSGMRIATVSAAPTSSISIFSSSMNGPFNIEEIKNKTSFRAVFSEQIEKGSDRAAVLGFEENDVVIECVDDSSKCSIIPFTLGSDGNYYFQIQNNTFYGIYSLDTN